MKTIYSICSEVNDGGWTNSDKSFPTPELANKYLRKLAARIILNLRDSGLKVRYLNVYKFDKNNTSFPATIEIGGFNSVQGWLRYDIRVKTTVLFEDEEDFNKFPIQI